MDIKNKRKSKVIYWSYFIAMFAGMGGVTGGMFLFENTIVSWKIIVVIYFVAGFVMTPLTSVSLERYCKLKGLFLKTIFNIITFGGTLIGLSIALNYYFTNDEQHNYKLKIINKGYTKSRGRLNKPYADVEINSNIKSIAFPYGYNLEGYKYLEMTTETGLLGFEVIKSKYPVIE